MAKNRRLNGILGIAFESPLFEAMNQKLLPENIFTIFIRNTQNGEDLDAGGGKHFKKIIFKQFLVLTIGAIDNENCGEIIGWADVKNDGLWTFQIDVSTKLE